MEPRQQLALMDKIIRELDDLKNSQTSVLKKIAQVEADNINLGIGLLNDALPGIHEEVDDAVEKVTTLLDGFKEHRDKYENDNQQALAESPPQNS
jgi:ethanolamine ammonia-lyase large subunit